MQDAKIDYWSRRGQHWTRDKVLAEIRRRYQARESLKVRQIPNRLLLAAVRYFDSWATAIQMASLDYDSITSRRHWTREKVIAEIRKLEADDVPLSGEWIAQHHCALHQAALKFFPKSWMKALRAAGFNPLDHKKRKGRWTTKKAAAWVQERIKTGRSLLGRDAPRNLLDFVVKVLKKRWTDYIESFKIPYPGVKKCRDWSKKKVLEEIRRLAAQGQPTNLRSVALESQALIHQARKHFKGWDAARRAAGVEVTHGRIGPPTRFTAEELLEEIRRWKAAGRLTNQGTVQRENYALLYYARKYFKSWRGACAAAGVEVAVLPRHPPPRFTALQLLEQIRRWKAAGHLTNQNSVNRENATLLTYARKYFKNWRNACTAAGVEVDRLPRGPAARKKRP